MAYIARGAERPTALAAEGAVSAPSNEEVGAAEDREKRGVAVDEDQYHNHGRDYMVNILIKLQQWQGELTGWKVEQFAHSVAKAGDLLLRLQDQRDSRYDNLPIEIPTNPALQ